MYQLRLFRTSTTGLFLGDAHDAEYGFSSLKDTVHFFKRSICRFRIKEVDNGEDESVARNNIRFLDYNTVGKDLDLHHRKYHVGFVPDACKSHWGDHNDRKIEKPVCTCRKGIGWGTDFERNNF